MAFAPVRVSQPAGQQHTCILHRHRNTRLSSKSTLMCCNHSRQPHCSRSISTPPADAVTAIAIAAARCGCARLTCPSSTYTNHHTEEHSCFPAHPVSVMAICTKPPNMYLTIPPPPPTHPLRNPLTAIYMPPSPHLLWARGSSLPEQWPSCPGTPALHQTAHQHHPPHEQDYRPEGGGGGGGGGATVQAVSGFSILVCEGNAN
mgnify:CR=1 FL=1